MILHQVAPKLFSIDTIQIVIENNQLDQFSMKLMTPICDFLHIPVDIWIVLCTLVTSLMSLMASLVTTSRIQQCFKLLIDIYYEFLLLFYCCVLLEIKLTTTNVVISVQAIRGGCRFQQPHPSWQPGLRSGLNFHRSDALDSTNNKNSLISAKCISLSLTDCHVIFLKFSSHGNQDFPWVRQ